MPRIITDFSRQLRAKSEINQDAGDDVSSTESKDQGLLGSKALGSKGGGGATVAKTALVKMGGRGPRNPFKVAPSTPY